MNITSDVITDLLPLYLAGEASPGTRKLLEEYLREHPEFAATVRDAAARSAALLDAGDAHIPPDHEKATLERVRRFNHRRRVLLGLAIGFALSVFAFGFEGGHIRWFMLRDSPIQALLFLLSAFSCSLAYLVMTRRVRG
jgi:predicted anti-sigma-YlaC factor YlaD